MKLIISLPNHVPLLIDLRKYHLQAKMSKSSFVSAFPVSCLSDPSSNFDTIKAPHHLQCGYVSPATIQLFYHSIPLIANPLLLLRHPCYLSDRYSINFIFLGYVSESRMIYKNLNQILKENLTLFTFVFLEPTQYLGHSRCLFF